jgi:hypothetical protein
MKFLCSRCGETAAPCPCRAETFDAVDHPPHYTSSPARCPSCGQGIECIDVVEHMGFNLGNAVKYLWRCDAKGRALEDLRKSRWYLDREIARREGGA